MKITIFATDFQYFLRVNIVVIYRETGYTKYSYSNLYVSKYIYNLLLLEKYQQLIDDSFINIS